MESETVAGSKTAISSEVQVFHVEKTDATSTAWREIVYAPTSTSITPLTFNIPKQSMWMDLSQSYFEVKLTLKAVGGANIDAANNQVFPVPGMIHAMIKQFTVHWNGTLMTPSANTYPFGWYLTTILNYTTEEANSLLRAEGWPGTDRTQGYAPIDFPITITANRMDTTNGDFDALSDAQKAAVRQSLKMRTLVGGGREVYFRFKPDLEIFYLNRWVIPGVQQQYQIDFNPSAFWINGTGATAVRLQPEDIEFRFHACQLTLAPELYKKVMAAHQVRRIPVKYPTVKHIVRTFTIQQGVREWWEDKVFEGGVPDRVVLGLLHPDSFTGIQTRHPFCFQKFDVEEVRQTINGEVYPVKPLELYGNNNHRDILGYHQMFDQGGFLKSGETPMIYPEMWGRGGNCTLYFYDNTPTKNANSWLHNPQQKGDIRLYVRFRGNTGHPITVIVYGEFESQIEIDGNGTVLFDPFH